MDKKLIPVKLDTYKPLREIVFESIREAIINGTLKQGERLMETKLADALGVSRTPIREAIRKLELEGLVSMEPRKGAYVAGIMEKDVADILELRAVLESLAAKLAVERITPEELAKLRQTNDEIEKMLEKDDIDKAIDADTEFHHALIAAGKNSRLLSVTNNLQEQIQRFRIIVTKERKDLILKSCEDHKYLIDLIEKGDSAKAEDVAKEHVRKTENYIMQIIARENEEKKERKKDK